MTGMTENTQDWHDTAEAMMDLCGTPMWRAAAIARDVHGLENNVAGWTEFVERWRDMAAPVLGWLDEDDDDTVDAPWIDAFLAGDADDDVVCACAFGGPCGDTEVW